MATAQVTTGPLSEPTTTYQGCIYASSADSTLRVHILVSLFLFRFPLVECTSKMTSIEVKALPECLGFTLQYVSLVFVVHCHDSPVGTVFPLTWYRWGTVARNACIDLEVGQRGFWLWLIILISQKRKFLRIVTLSEIWLLRNVILSEIWFS